jgi:hypothetical protein
MPFQTTPAPRPADQLPAQTGAGTPTATPAQPSVATPRDIYLGLREKREVLWNQKSRLENEREEIVQQIRRGSVSDADKAGLDQRLAAVDQQIAKVSIDIAEADAQVAAGAAVPGALDEGPRADPWATGPPVELVGVGMALTAVLMFPLVIAWARRLWRKANVVSAVPEELIDRMGNIERNLETVALEVERIGEGQRFVTQLMAQRGEPVREALADPRKAPPA